MSSYDRLLQIQGNVPKSSSDYYNQSFVDKIKEAQDSIDNAVAERDKASSAEQQAYDEYNAFRGNMSSYSEKYADYGKQFGVEQRQDEYEKSKNAVLIAESALSALPSSIRASSDVVMTSSKLSSTYNSMADTYTRSVELANQQKNSYEQAFENAREQQLGRANEDITAEWSKLDTYNEAWKSSIQAYNDAADRLDKAKTEKSNWEAQYSEWQGQQRQAAYQVWLSELQAATDRYISDSNTRMAQYEAKEKEIRADIEAARAQADASEYRYKELMANYILDRYYYHYY